MDSLAPNLSQYLDLVVRDSFKTWKAEHSSTIYKSLLQRKKEISIHKQGREPC